MDTILGSTNMEIPGTIYLRLKLTILTVVTIKNGTFSDMTPCSLVEFFRRFAGKHYLHLQG
jgi:hypothetical protein